MAGGRLHLCKANYAAGKRPAFVALPVDRATMFGDTWATINALQFLESEPWINIFDHTGTATPTFLQRMTRQRAVTGR
jgi:hypothetical protein